MNKNKLSFLKSVSALTTAALLAVSAGCASEKVPENDEITVETAAAQQQTEAADVAVTENADTATSSVDVSEPSTSAEEVTEFVLPQEIPEIVELFNEKANTIKTDAVKVVKNYEKRNVNEEELVIPAALESTAKSLMKTFLSDDTEPIIYDTKEEITTEYIVPEKPYVSKLEPQYVKTATCTDNGDTYTIHLVIKDESNPVSGKGVGAVCDVIEAHEVSEKVSFIESFTTEYYNCEAEITVNKATGRVIHSNYNVPLVLTVTVDLFGRHTIAAGLSFEKDYTIYY
ncbi:MAG: hypothetical protein J6A60_02680 [Clostridia bacterium]|nr:hypothetical protein [Clostridia bacterium]